MNDVCPELGISACLPLTTGIPCSSPFDLN